MAKLLLDKNDFMSVISIIDALSQRGFLKGEELYDMGVLYRRFQSQLETIVQEEKKTQEVKEKTELRKIEEDIDSRL